MSNSEIKIYIADLAAYNQGYLHGTWIDACEDVNDIQNSIHQLLANSPVENAEEYAIHDTEGFEQYDIGEYTAIDTVHEIACFIRDHTDFGALLLKQFHGDIEQAHQTAEEHYCGCYTSIEDYAQQQTQELYDVPEYLEQYIDYERMGRDIEIGGDIFTLETSYQEVHVFRNV